ncbi:MAG: hypothetical protein JNL83_25375 [Myxococcales bacterium]|nr:hypothetical protein [Myxococcales bacterium]
MRTLLALSLAACGSSSPPAAAPPAPVVPPIDAAIDAAPDAGVPQAVLDAPAWVFRYSTADRKETWTLRHADGQALLVVETAQGAQRYLGTMTNGALAVSTGTAKLALDCKPARRALSAKCNDTKAPKIEVLDCYHPDFKEPMPFGKEPGVEYVVSADCSGYRLAAP